MKQISKFLTIQLVVQLAIIMQYFGCQVVGVGFRNQATGFALDSDGAGNVYTHSPNGGGFQNWIIRNTDNNAIFLRNDATGRFLNSDFSGKLSTQPFNGGVNQRWKFSGLRIISEATGRAVDSNFNGQAYTLQPNGANFQNWIHF